MEKVENGNEEFKLTFVDIPKIFKTSISEDFFRKCLICERDLIENDEEYLIEKVISNGKIELEYAICLDCLQKEREKLSAESLERIEKFFNSYQKKFIRRKEMLNDINDVNLYLKNCLISDLEIKNDSDYHIFAHCVGDKMLLGFYPYALRFEVIDYIQTILSKKTKDELDNFRRRYFDLPPDLYDILNKKRVPLLI